MNFNELEWHDSLIKKITVDKSNGGINDKIIIEVVWANNNSRELVIFEEVYWGLFDLNFGIIADDSFRHAIMIDQGDELAQFIAKWPTLYSNKPLKIYTFILNSTGSEFKIIAENFRIQK